MKRVHIHIVVDDISASARFYATILGAVPTVKKPDYVKWQLDDPRVNLAISTKSGNVAGLDHFGIQCDSTAALERLHASLGEAGVATFDEQAAQCCYAESDKHWAVDPNGHVWELFHTMRDVAVYGSDRARDVNERLGGTEPTRRE